MDRLSSLLPSEVSLDSLEDSLVLANERHHSCSYTVKLGDTVATIGVRLIKMIHGDRSEESMSSFYLFKLSKVDKSQARRLYLIVFKIVAAQKEASGLSAEDVGDVLTHFCPIDEDYTDAFFKKPS